jgi:hypothetical protein
MALETNGQIDAGVVSGAISAFRFNQPMDVFPWAWENVIEVTSILINTKHIYVSPEPLSLLPPTEPHGPITKDMATIVDYGHSECDVSKFAEDYTKCWARKNAVHIQAIYKRLSGDDIGYGTWLEHVLENSLQGHCIRKGGVCDNVFIMEVADVLGMEVDEIMNIQEQSANPEQLELLRNRQANSHDFRRMIDCFVVSGIIRGRYYGTMAARTNRQFLSHQLRSEVFSDIIDKPVTEYLVSNTERYLSAIIVASAFREGQHRFRISEWFNSVMKARRATMEDRLDLRPKDFNEVAVSEAVRLAKLLDIRTKSKWIDKGIDAGFAIGVGVLTSFVLSPWSGFLLGLASGAASDRMKIGERIGETFETKRSLRKLAVADPGSIRRTWAAGMRA